MRRLQEEGTFPPSSSVGLLIYLLYLAVPCIWLLWHSRLSQNRAPTVWSAASCLQLPQIYQNTVDPPQGLTHVFAMTPAPSCHIVSDILVTDLALYGQISSRSLKRDNTATSLLSSDPWPWPPHMGASHQAKMEVLSLGSVCVLLQISARSTCFSYRVPFACLSTINQYQSIVQNPTIPCS